MPKAQRLVGPLVLLVLVVAVAAAAFVSFDRAQSARETARREAAVVTVRGLIGSEKGPYLTDPRVLAILRKNGINLVVETAGSREIATRTDVKTYDFGFPAGEPAARKLMSATGVRATYTPFFTPMAVASWTPIANILVANHMVRRGADRTYVVDMNALLTAVRANRRWSQLGGNGAYDIDKALLIASTDVRKSNSAAMYLALASYLFNGGNVVTTQEQERKILPDLTALFIRQGYQESTSAGPFDDYVSIGMGKAPLVMIYESQFIEYQAEHRQNRNGEMVLLYPRPTIFTKHTLVPFNAKGEKLGRLLSDDPDLQRLAIEHGFRNQNGDEERRFWNTTGVHVPAQLLDVIDPPSYEVIESMITSIERAYAAQ